LKARTPKQQGLFSIRTEAHVTKSTVRKNKVALKFWIQLPCTLGLFRPEKPGIPSNGQEHSKYSSWSSASQTDLSHCPLLTCFSIPSIALPSCLMPQMRHFPDGVLLLMLVV